MDYSFNKEKIADGIELCNVFSEAFKSAVVTISFVMPLSSKASLYALVPNVLARASEKYPDLTSIEKKLALLYGAEIMVDISKVGENQVLKMGIDCIDDRFAFDNESIVAESSKLMLELIFKPLLKNGIFLDEVVESEKRLLKEQLESEMSDKRIYAKAKCDEYMFSKELFGIHRLGTVEDIEKITSQKLYDAYIEILETAKITLCISGNTDTELVSKYLKQYTKDINRRFILNETIYVPKAQEVKYYSEEQAINQGKLVMGFRLGMKDIKDNFPARRIMTDLFGGSPHSKLFKVVREKMSLCYYCSARMFRAKGVMFVQSGIESYNEEKIKAAILEQLEEIKKGNFTEEDIEASVKALEDSYKSILDSPEALDAWYMSQCISGEYHRPEHFINQYKNVTKADVIKAAEDVTLDTVFMLKGAVEDGDSYE